MVVEVVLGVCLMVEMMVAVVAALGSATTTTSPWSIDKFRLLRCGVVIE